MEDPGSGYQEGSSLAPWQTGALGASPSPQPSLGRMGAASAPDCALHPPRFPLPVPAAVSTCSPPPPSALGHLDPPGPRLLPPWGPVPVMT